MKVVYIKIKLVQPGEFTLTGENIKVLVSETSITVNDRVFLAAEVKSFETKVSW